MRNQSAVSEGSAAVRTIAFWAAILATLPYLALKVAWMAGLTIGLEDEAAIEAMRTPRFVVGNAVTAAMELAAIASAFALTRPWGRRVPGWLATVTAGAATGLLVPILFGLPLGMVLQAASGRPFTAAEDGGLAGWAFVVVYSGFGLLAAALAVLFGLYAVTRWGALLSGAPRPPKRWVSMVGAVGLLPIGVAMTVWGVLGPGALGPSGMTALDQRMSLVVTGVLAIAAFLAPQRRTSSLRAARARWAVLWTGCACAALQGVAHLLLAEGGRLQPVVAILAALATPGAAVFYLGVLRASQRGAGSGGRGE